MRLIDPLASLPGPLPVARCFLHAPPRLTRQSGQTHLTIGLAYAEVAWVESAWRQIAGFFKTRRQTALAPEATPVARMTSGLKTKRLRIGNPGPQGR